MFELICDLVLLPLTTTIFLGTIIYLGVAEGRIPSKCHTKGLYIWLEIAIFLVIIADALDMIYAIKIRSGRARTRRWINAVAKRRLRLRSADNTGEEEAEPELPPPPRPGRPPSRPSDGWIIVRVIWFFNAFVIVPSLTADYRYNIADRRCRRTPWALRTQLAFLLLLWAQMLMEFLIAPLVRSSVKKRPLIAIEDTPLHTLPTQPGYTFVQRVCYVSDLAKFKPEELPYPPVEIEADSASCGICYEDFEDPLSPLRRKLRLKRAKKSGKLSAPTLWKTRCAHVFHEDCLLQWFKASGGSVCPYCNQDTSALPASSSSPATAPRA